jgi:hypothetical protein
MHMTRSDSEGKVTLIELAYLTLLALGAMGGWVFGKIHFGFWSACLFGVLGLGLGFGACFVFAFILNTIFSPPTKTSKQ